MVCGYPKAKRETTPIMVLTALACLDDSGSEPSSFNCVIAGFLTAAPLWEKFSDEWYAVLKLTPSLEYFKMSEAESLKGQFSGWTAKQRDERLDMLSDIIIQARVLAMDIVVYWDDYKRIVQGKLPEQIR